MKKVQWRILSGREQEQIANHTPSPTIQVQHVIGYLLLHMPRQSSPVALVFF